MLGFGPHPNLRSGSSRRHVRAGRLGACAREAPLFNIGPTARTHAGNPCGRDGPAPSTAPSPRPANRGRRACPARPCSGRVFKGLLDVGDTHQPKPQVVVAIVGMVVVAVGATRVLAVVVPRAAAHHAPGPTRPPHRFAPAVAVSRFRGSSTSVVQMWILRAGRCAALQRSRGSETQ